jgi:hypothetical protein
MFVAYGMSHMYRQYRDRKMKQAQQLTIIDPPFANTTVRMSRRSRKKWRL